MHKDKQSPKDTLPVTNNKSYASFRPSAVVTIMCIKKDNVNVDTIGATSAAIEDAITIFRVATRISGSSFGANRDSHTISSSTSSFEIVLRSIFVRAEHSIPER